MKKYNRTYHFSFSPEIKSDDKTLSTQAEKNFINKELIITEKLDGGNACLHKNLVFARTHAQEASHSSFSMLKSISAILNAYEDRRDILLNHMVFGENMEGIHSIEYSNLTDPFYIFNIKKESVWLSWNEIEDLSKQLRLPIVPVIFRGSFKNIKELEEFLNEELRKESVLGAKREGFVVRPASEFNDNEFSSVVGKYVRNGHVQTDEHWSKNYKTANFNFVNSKLFQ